MSPRGHSRSLRTSETGENERVKKKDDAPADDVAGSLTCDRFASSGGPEPSVCDGRRPLSVGGRDASPGRGQIRPVGGGLSPSIRHFLFGSRSMIAKLPCGQRPGQRSSARYLTMTANACRASGVTGRLHTIRSSRARGRRSHRVRRGQAPAGVATLSILRTRPRRGLVLAHRRGGRTRGLEHSRARAVIEPTIGGFVDEQQLAAGGWGRGRPPCETR